MDGRHGLTDSQIEAALGAVGELSGVPNWRDRLIAAAPHLQLPLREPTLEQARRIAEATKCREEHIYAALCTFVEEQNAAHGNGVGSFAAVQQLPWGEPTEDEIAAAYKLWMSLPSATTGHQMLHDAVCEVFRIRNLSLLPKPVDPRREKVVQAFIDASGAEYIGQRADAERKADIALKALDGGAGK